MNKIISNRAFSVLSHIDAKTATPTMVDVSFKAPSQRIAHAKATVILPPIFYPMLYSQNGDLNKEIFAAKGPVFSTAIVAGVMAAKKTAELIPFCHPIPIEDCKITIRLESENALDLSLVAKCTNVLIDCIVKTTNKTGVEMEAMIGATNSALCIYDMLKAVSHDIQIKDVVLMKKSGGKSSFQRTEKDAEISHKNDDICSIK